MWYEMVPNRMGPYSKIPGSEYAKVFYCGEKDDRVVVTFSKILSMSVVSNMLIANPKIVMIHHCALSEEVEGMIRAYQVLPESNFTVKLYCEHEPCLRCRSYAECEARHA